ncbi:hypothetical protein ACFL7D_12005 [candidate division KSB1 bacterium]
MPLNSADEFLVVSSNKIGRVSTTGSDPEFFDIEIRLQEVKVVNNSNDKPEAIIGSGFYGKPSAAILNLEGQCMWRYDGGVSSMGRAAIIEDSDIRYVIVNKRREGLLFFDYESGEIIRKGDPIDVKDWADFTGDNHQEALLSPSECNYTVVNGSGKEVASLSVSSDYWYRPIVIQFGHPYLVMSAGSVLDVYDSEMKQVKRYDAQGASPLHVVAATYVGTGPDAPFVAIYKGWGRWLRSVLYVFSNDGTLVYKEILDDSYNSLTPLEGNDGTAFLLGGRNEIFKYSFQHRE